MYIKPFWASRTEVVDGNWDDVELWFVRADLVSYRIWNVDNELH